jgi:hypothetical protein
MSTSKIEGFKMTDFFYFGGRKIKLTPEVGRITIAQLGKALHRAGLKIKVELKPIKETGK